MGLNYNYLLYFKHDQLWDVLQGLAEISESMEPTTIQFPDHELLLPIMSSWGENKVISYDQPEFEFSLVLKFAEDEAILDYLHNRDGDQFDRSPPEDGQEKFIQSVLST